jgi:CheY-like chemotaxis protein
MRILILEDDPTRVKAFSQSLGGYDIVVEKKAAAAISRLEHETWDILFLDHDLDGQVLVSSGPGTGYEVALWLSEHPDRKPKSVVLHSFNEQGRKKMKERLPEALELPGAWAFIEQNWAKIEPK